MSELVKTVAMLVVVYSFLAQSHGHARGKFF